jgi:hypothetical protein
VEVAPGGRPTTTWFRCRRSPRRGEPTLGEAVVKGRAQGPGVPARPGEHKGRWRSSAAGHGGARELREEGVLAMVVASGKG